MQISVVLLQQKSAGVFGVQTPGAPPPAPGMGAAQNAAAFTAHVPTVSPAVASTTHTSPAGHCESEVHLPQTFGVPPPPQTGAAVGQSLLWQHDVPPPVAPGMHAQVSAAAQSAAPPVSQQISAGLAHVLAAIVHVEETHAPLVVSQIVPVP